MSTARPTADQAPGSLTLTENIPATTRIVVGVGSAPSAAGPLAWVAQQAKARSLHVLVVHAWHDAAQRDGSWPDAGMLDAPQAQPGALAVDILKFNGIDASVQTIFDDDAGALQSMLEPGDEVVVGSQNGHDVSRAFGANVAHALLEHAPCPVVLVPDAWQPRVTGASRVVVAYDEESALRWAVSQCEALGARLDLIRAHLSVVPAFSRSSSAPSDAELTTRVQALAAAHGVEDVRVVNVSPALTGIAMALDAASEGAQALVLGNHHASWLAELTQFSVTERVITHAPCPVVVVPDERPST